MESSLPRIVQGNDERRLSDLDRRLDVDRHGGYSSLQEVRLRQRANDAHARFATDVCKIPATARSSQWWSGPEGGDPLGRDLDGEHGCYNEGLRVFEAACRSDPRLTNGCGFFTVLIYFLLEMRGQNLSQIL